MRTSPDPDSNEKYWVCPRCKTCGNSTEASPKRCPRCGETTKIVTLKRT